MTVEIVLLWKRDGFIFFLETNFFALLLLFVPVRDLNLLRPLELELELVLGIAISLGKI